jgi:endonuclease/exonuclease/phosphatase family metal-dependent hydrolase
VVSLLTINLYNGRADAAELADLLDQLRPDVVAAQELAPDAALVLADRFHHGFLRPATDYTGMGLVAARPLVEMTAVPIPGHRGVAGRLGDLLVITIHLANPVMFPPTLALRRRQVEALSSWLSHTPHPGQRVLMGDFNATPLWPAYRRLTRLMPDGVAAWAKEQGKRPSRTWGYHPRLPAMLRIDHVLVEGMKVTDSSVHRLRGGDHRALWVRLERP